MLTSALNLKRKISVEGPSGFIKRQAVAVTTKAEAETKFAIKTKYNHESLSREAARTARATTKSLFNPGGILDSQTSDTQYFGSNTYYPSSPTLASVREATRVSANSSGVDHQQKTDNTVCTPDRIAQVNIPKKVARGCARKTTGRDTTAILRDLVSARKQVTDLEIELVEACVTESESPSPKEFRDRNYNLGVNTPSPSKSSRRSSSASPTPVRIHDSSPETQTWERHGHHAFSPYIQDPPCPSIDSQIWNTVCKGFNE